MSQLPESAIRFLKQLKKNNNRDWFEKNKLAFKEEEAKLKIFYSNVLDDLTKIDNIDKMKIFRIYRDVRFSKDKTPYNIHRSVSFSRATEKLRGGYYLRIEPGKSMVAGGFFQPNSKDLLRIRKEFETDASEARRIFNDDNFVKLFGNIEGDEVKSAPRGFDKTHPSIDLIRKKSFIVTRNFTDSEVLASDFKDEIIESYGALRPFFDYMSDILTTDLNGISVLKNE
ncbi:DUF2461 domain-containing protein [uncultured Polaribacter sp.]|uniref:DUF2461 domain-containing protein n=1 Tax=uncultured Polaribacter sp. TaxID=174711 RepID=UPI002607C2B8|nr:DUF2461 domain-containing protein [uncultured Polaribacter sp.]